MRSALIIWLVTATTGWAGEFAIFASGSRLHVDSHEFTGSLVRLHSGDGYTDLAQSAILGFEPDGAAATEPAAQSEPRKADLAKQLAPLQLADAAADKYGLPRQLVRSVMAAESGFDPLAVSPKGALGLMQLMPDTARILGADPNDALQNVDAGTRYLRDLLLKYNGQLWHALAAYNAGPEALEKYHNQIPPYRETILYIEKIDRDMKRASGAAQ